MFKQLKDIPHYWKIDKLDFLTWIVTFLSTIILDVDYGLMIGLITLLFLNTHRNQNLVLKSLGQVNDYEIHSDITKYIAHEHETIKVFSPTHSLLYINADNLRMEINRACPLKDMTEDLTICEHCYQNYGCLCCCCGKSDEVSLNGTVEANNEDQRLNQASPVKGEDKKYYKVIILDCTLIQFIDESGVKCLREVIKEYNKEDVKFLLANCNGKFILSKKIQKILPLIID